MTELCDKNLQKTVTDDDSTIEEEQQTECHDVAKESACESAAAPTPATIDVKDVESGVPRRRRGAAAAGGSLSRQNSTDRKSVRQASRVAESTPDPSCMNESDNDDSNDELLSDIVSKAKEKRPEDDDGTSTPKERKRRKPYKKRKFRLSVQKLGVPGRKRKRDEPSEQTQASTAPEKEPTPEPENLVMPTPSREELALYTPMQLLCDYFLRAMLRKDPDEYFVFPVTEDVAPDYSNVVKTPMDMYTMRLKIDKNEYDNLLQFKNDAYLIYENAIEYNTVDTVYHLAAQKYKQVVDFLFGKAHMEYLPHELPFFDNIDASLLNLSDVAAEKAPTPNEQSQSAEWRVQAEKNVEQNDCSVNKVPQLAALKLNIILPEHVGDSPCRTKESKTLGERVPQHRDGGVKWLPSGTLPSDPYVPPRHLDYGAYASFAPCYDSSWATVDAQTSRDMDTHLAGLPGAWVKTEKNTAADTTDDIDFEQLRSLRQVGIDVSFLDSLERDLAPRQQSSTNALLDTNASLLGQLRRAQMQRLALPPHTEDITDAITGNLVKLLAEIKPRDVVSTQAVRAAVTLDTTSG